MRRAIQGVLMGVLWRNHRGEAVAMFGWMTRLGALRGWRA